MPLGRAKDPRFVLDRVLDRQTLVERYVLRSGRDRRPSAGTTCLPGGSWPSSSRAATPSISVASPTTRCTSTSATRSTGCSTVQPPSSNPGGRSDRFRPEAPSGRRCGSPGTIDGALMRAWQVQAKGEPIEVLRPVVIDCPEPGVGQVRIQVTAAGIGLPDVLMCRHTYPLTPPLPFVPGQEVSGVITAIGDGVGPLVGDRVMAVTAFQDGYGSFAENAWRLRPPSRGARRAHRRGGGRFWIPHLTGWVGLVDRGGIAEGEWLAVLGAGGGSGIAAVQLGRLLGARVIAVVGDEERASLCRSLGAEATWTIARARWPPCSRPDRRPWRRPDLRPGRRLAGRGRGRCAGPERPLAGRRLCQRVMAEGRNPPVGVGQRCADGRVGRGFQPSRARSHPRSSLRSGRRGRVAQCGDRAGFLRRSSRCGPARG